MKFAQVLELECRHKPAFNLADFAEKKAHFGSAAAIHFKARICDHLALMLEETRLSENQIISPVLIPDLGKLVQTLLIAGNCAGGF
jgi:hypothetical protein